MDTCERQSYRGCEHSEKLVDHERLQRRRYQLGPKEREQIAQTETWTCDGHERTILQSLRASVLALNMIMPNLPIRRRRRRRHPPYSRPVPRQSLGWLAF